MAFEQAGVQLEAQGAGAFSGDMASASGAVNNFSSSAQAAGAKTSAFGEIMTGAFRHIGTLAVDAFMAAGKAALDFVGDGISAARETEKLNASTEQTIKTMGNAAGRTAKQVSELASALSDASGKSLFGDDQIQQSENLLLTFGNIKGETFDLATALTVDLAAALGGAPKDHAMMLGKALQDPIKGMAALGKAGLTFSVEQKAAIAAMVESGDIAGAQSLIIAELTKQVGGQAEAQAQAAGGMVQFKARLGEVGETIGAALLPMLNQMADFLNTTIAPAIEAAAAALSAWLADPAVQAGIQEITDAIGSGLSAAFDFIANTAIPALIEAWNMLQPALQFVQGLFAQTGDSASGMGSTIQSVVDTVIAVASAYVEIVGAELQMVADFWAAHGDEITAFAESAWSQISEIIESAMQLIQATVVPAFQEIAGFIQAHGADIQNFLSGAWQTISSVIQAALTLISGIIKATLQAVQGDWSGAWTTIQNMSASFVTSIGSAITGFLGMIAALFGTTLSEIGSTWSSNWNNMVSLVTGAVENIVGIIMSLPSQVVGVGAAAVQAIADGFMSAWNGFIADVQAKLQELADQLPFSEPKDPSSPLRGLVGRGRAIAEMLQQGMDSAGPLQVGGMASPALDAAALRMGGGSQTNSSTYSNTYNYAPTYGRAPRAPAQDFQSMKAFAL